MCLRSCKCISVLAFSFIKMTNTSTSFFNYVRRSYILIIVMRRSALANWWSMFHTLGMFYLALNVVMRRWQLTEHELYLRDILSCSDHCHETMSTDGVCFIPKGWITIVWPLSWEDDNWQSRFQKLGKNAPSVVIVSWNWSEHGYISLKYEYGSVSWHRLMTTVRAWLYIHQVWNMLCQLSSSNDNGHSMIIHP